MWFTVYVYSLCYSIICPLSATRLHAALVATSNIISSLASHVSVVNHSTQRTLDALSTTYEQAENEKPGGVILPWPLHRSSAAPEGTGIARW